MGPKHELRISFPEGDHHPSYNIAVQRLLDERSSESSIRTDNYYVTEAHFGLKQRNGEALELKVRDKETESGLELWTKSSLSNSMVDLCREEISVILGDKGYSAKAEELIIGEIVALTKDVSKVKHDKVNYEVTRISTEHPSAMHKNWVSVVIEGKHVKNVLSFLSSAPETKGVREAIKTAHQLGEIRPVVAGYPLFVRQVASQTTESDHAELDVRWQQLLSYV